jgi:hypothetical protein
MPRRRIGFAVLGALVAAFELTGCGREATVLPPAPKGAPTIGPHQGTAFALPNNAGLAEVVNEPEPTGRGNAAATAVVVYFLKPDASTPLTPPPTQVRVRVDQGERKQETLELKAEPRSSDPTGAARFASKTGPYALFDLRGVLTGSAGGSEFKVTLSGVR